MAKTKDNNEAVLEMKDTKKKASGKNEEKLTPRQMKEKALETAISQLEKEFGKGTVMKLGDAQNTMNVEAIPTGSLSLDIALGVGGIPRGRIVEVYGPESGGKTTLSLHMVAEVQKRGGIAGFVDAEHALDPVYARNIGVDIDSVCKIKLTVTLNTCNSAVLYQLKLTATVNKTKCVVIFINQLREKIGVMFGNNETTTGGRALKFYASVRLVLSAKLDDVPFVSLFGVESHWKGGPSAHCLM